MTAASFCNACGAQFEDDDRFCANCGAGRPVATLEDKPTPRWSEVAASSWPASPIRVESQTASGTERGTNAGGWVFIGIVAIGLIVGAFVLFGGNSANFPQHMLLGSVLIQQPENFSATGLSCIGQGPLADMRSGAAVTIRNGDGDVVATGTLEQGVVTPEGNCRLRYGVEIPETGQYVFEIGQQPPTRPTTRAMLENSAINARMTDGDWWITHGYD